MPVSLFTFDNTFAAHMEGFYVPWQGAAFPAPKMVKFNRALAAELGLDADDIAALHRIMAKINPSLTPSDEPVA